MGATNWAKCPRCERRHQLKVNASMKRLGEIYGSMPLADWQAEQQAHIDLSIQVLQPTLREDYTIRLGMMGDLVIHYSGQCSICNYICNFDHAEDVYDPLTEPEPPAPAPKRQKVAPGANTP